MYALLIGFVALNVYPPTFVINYVYKHKPNSDISKITQSADVLKGAPNMLNNMVRAMAIDFIDRGVK
jgi:hypothetical protein